MNYYINNLIPRLKEYSASLDKIEIFIDHPWVIIDENNNQQKYIFKRDGQLIMSFNGQVKIGKWEYLSYAKSLLIDRIDDKVLLNQNFVCPGVMVLKKDGFKEDHWILANETLIPDLDAAKYLKKLYYQKQNITVKDLKTGYLLELNEYDGIGSLKNTRVSIDGENVSDGILEVKDDLRRWVVKDSKIHKVLVAYEYNSNLGKIIVEQEEYLDIQRGDTVYIKKTGGLGETKMEFAPDGKYNIGFLNNLIVKDGKIVKFSSF
ncbi:hypothetical protein GXP67_12575 [Rhodocytophaga rosea]|uniref:Uncharacterized protein n=1 Tax=Rhodocytophaga rosea TaxID=2704465 RepID=A0A6C0GHH7_9BACT|nr:hypothetical protein [Rhodocytophaga rosea]QHT67409.1 hypothetical protein GXP67_12575 [Rhodocytophaga rosea]